MVQMLVEGGAAERNLQRATQYIDEAASNGADIVLLPECLDLDWTHPSCLHNASPIPGGEPYQYLAAQAERFGVTVCAGLSERDGDQVFNTAVLIDQRGKLLSILLK